MRFNHPPEAVKKCPCGAVVSRGHFFSGPLVFLDSPFAGRMDPRIFWSSFQLFESGVS